MQSDLRVYNTHSSDSGGSSVSHAEVLGEGAVGGGGMWGRRGMGGWGLGVS